MRLQVAIAEPADSARQLERGDVATGLRGVTSLGAGGHDEAAHPLLCRLTRIEEASPDAGRATTPLVDGTLGLEDLGQVAHQPAHPQAPTMLLIGGSRQDDIALEGEPTGRERQQGHSVDSHHLLHIGCATAPDVAGMHLGPKGGVLPLLGVGRDDIRMAHEHDGPGLPRATQARHEVAASRRRFKDARFDAGGAQQIRQVASARRLVARRIRRVDAHEVAQDIDHLLPIGPSGEFHSASSSELPQLSTST